jgi:hypothetical protein
MFTHTGRHTGTNGCATTDNARHKHILVLDDAERVVVVEVQVAAHLVHDGRGDVVAFTRCGQQRTQTLDILHWW